MYDYQSAYGRNQYQQYPAYQSMYQTPSYSPQNGLIRVTGIDGARAYQMSPNSSAALFDGERDVFYVKSTDGAGFPTIRAYRFEPLDESPSPQGVTSDQIFDLQRQINELKEVVGNGKQSVRKQPKPDEQ